MKKHMNIISHLNNMVKGTIWFVLCFLCLTSVAASQIRTENQQNNEKLDQIRRQIEESSRNAENLEKETRNVQQEIAGIQQRLIRSASEIQSIEDEIFMREATLEELRDREITLEENLQKKNFEMASTLGAMQRLSIQKTNAVAFKPDEAINTLRTTSLLKVILPDLRNRADILKDELSELNDVRDDITLQNTELRAELTKLVIANEELDDLLAQRIDKQKDLQLSTEQERAKLKNFAENAEDLQDLIDKIETEIALREEASRRAVDNLRDKPNNGTNRTEQASIPMPSGSATFASAKGNIPLPARGSINQRFNQLLSSGQRSRGISLDTRPGATVIAPHEGRIVFAGPFRSYGQLLIIAHGEGYHTLLAGMENINGIVGQWVLKGEPVGQMSIESGSSNSRQKLYVELREKGKPINPTPWLVAANRGG